MSLARYEHEQIGEIAAWREDLNALHARVAPHFRRQVRARAGRTWRDCLLRSSGATAGSWPNN